MYRQGHGDCFLIAFPTEDENVPFYVLIDCGYKPGSQNFVTGRARKSIGDFVQHIKDSTNSTIDLMIITHEHQDHVNGIWKKNNPYFEGFTIKEAWFAWTESPTDKLAKKLRDKHNDQLLSLVNARNSLGLALSPKDPMLNKLDTLINLEFGGESEEFNFNEMSAAAKDPSRSQNKQSMKYVRDLASENRGVKYLNPGGRARRLKDVEGVRAYILGPPKDEELLLDEDPIGDEGFHAMSFSFSGALGTNRGDMNSPFAKKYIQQRATNTKFYKEFYGTEKSEESYEDHAEVTSSAKWRRIDEDWLFSADTLALKLNRGINNTSLVVAFELPKTKKVLLFAGDAQRGNWISWAGKEWRRGDVVTTTRDLLNRTVLYKVGHHGSHNATLDGSDDDKYANLSWMGHGEYANEFTAMITAVNKWAMTKNNPPWRHPLPSIRQALDNKCNGRVLQTDEATPTKPDSVSEAEWKKFTDRCICDKMFFDLKIMDT